ncbi:hypothetical protein [Clostridium oceanicum]|uniref:Uncharacterized protein n=1 Tax=Clostridium oceanicum TaxID=1543 RepID=A0ABP3UUE5_9CLOT
MTLYEECLDALKENYEIVIGSNKNKILNDFHSKFKLAILHKLKKN